MEVEVVVVICRVRGRKFPACLFLTLSLPHGITIIGTYYVQYIQNPQGHFSRDTQGNLQMMRRVSPASVVPPREEIFLVSGVQRVYCSKVAFWVYSYLNSVNLIQEAFSTQ